MSARRFRPLAALACAALAASAALADDGPAPAGAPAAEPAPADPLSIDVGGRSIMDFHGILDAGYRWVSGASGRYEQDLHLDDGLRVFRFSLEGTSTDRDANVDTLHVRASGIGDPYRRIEAGARRAGAYDLRVEQTRTEFTHAATYDPHPFDTVRETVGGSLRVHPAERLSVFVSTDRLTRAGDSRLAQAYAGEQSLPVEAPVRYERRSWTAGVDGATGPVRFGLRHIWSDAADTAFRTLDRPDTVVSDLGEFLTDSDVEGAVTSARAGTTLFGGRFELEAVGALTSSSTDSLITGSEIVTEPGLDGILGTPDDRRGSTETSATSAARLHGRDLRVDATVRPLDDWEVSARFQRRTEQERARLDYGTRFQDPPLSDPSEPFSRFRTAYRSHGELSRLGGEVAWRATPDVRLRAGAERIRGRVEQGGDGREEINPRTTATLLGAEWTPSDLFRGSLLLRHAATGGTETPLSTDTGDSLSFRARSRFLDGWHASSHVRLKDRSEDGNDSRVSADAYGVAAGYAAEPGWFEFSAMRHRFEVASDTAFVQDLSLGTTPVARRVRFGETVNQVSFDFSRRLFGPTRVFGGARWSKGTGDLPSVSRDVTLGVGWRLSERFEIRAEGRAVALDERRRNADDYGATMLVLAFEWTF